MVQGIHRLGDAAVLDKGAQLHRSQDSSTILSARMRLGGDPARHVLHRQHQVAAADAVHESCLITTAQLPHRGVG